MNSPQITTPTMSMEELATALTSIKAITSERDGLRLKLAETQRERNRAEDRVQLIQVELEKAQHDRDLYMRAAAKWAERIAAIGTLADQAKIVVAEAMKAGVLAEKEVERPTASQVLDNLLQGNGEANLTPSSNS